MFASVNFVISKRLNENFDVRNRLLVRAEAVMRGHRSDIAYFDKKK